MQEVKNYDLKEELHTGNKKGLDEVLISSNSLEDAVNSQLKANWLNTTAPKQESTVLFIVRHRKYPHLSIEYKDSKEAQDCVKRMGKGAYIYWHHEDENDREQRFTAYKEERNYANSSPHRSMTQSQPVGASTFARKTTTITRKNPVNRKKYQSNGYASQDSAIPVKSEEV